MEKFITFAGLLLIVAGITACGDDHVHEFTMHKQAPVAEQSQEKQEAAHGEAPSQTAAPVTEAAAGEQIVTDPRSIVWSTPEGWTAQAAGGMRLASYQTPDNGDVSVISLAGTAGGFIPNINRWRNQVDLAPQSEAEILKQVTDIASPVGTFRAVQLINPDNHAKAISAAIYEGKSFTLFIKLSGSPACVKKHTQAMYHFCAKAKLK